METNKDTTENKNDSVRQEYAFAADVKLKECKYCRVMIPQNAKVCPNCKMVLKQYTFLKVAAVVLAVAVAGGYFIAAYKGVLPDSVTPAWMAQSSSTAPDVSSTTVETAENAAGAKSVEPIGITVITPDEEAGQNANDENDTNTIASTVKNTENNIKSEIVDTTGQEKDLAKLDIPDKAEDFSAEDDIEDTETMEDQESTEDTEIQEGAERTKNTESIKDMKEDGVHKEESDNRDDREEDGDMADEKSENPEDDQEKVLPENADEDETAFRMDCVQVNYKSLVRAQEDYLDKPLLVVAEVICQVDGGLFDENIYYLCVEEESGGFERYYIIRDDRETDETIILEGDMITIYGTLFGNCKIPASLIETRPTVPAVSMLYCDLV